MRMRELRHLAIAAAVVLMPLALAAQPPEDAPRDPGRDRDTKDVRVPDEKVHEVLRGVRLEAQKKSAPVGADLEVARTELELAMRAAEIDEPKVMELADRIGHLETELRKIQLHSRIAVVKAVGPERARVLARILEQRDRERPGPPFMGRGGRRGEYRGGPPAWGGESRRGRRFGGHAMRSQGRSRGFGRSGMGRGRAGFGRSGMGRGRAGFGQRPFMAERMRQRLAQYPEARQWLQERLRGSRGEPGASFGPPWMRQRPGMEGGERPGRPGPGFGSRGREGQPPMPPMWGQGQGPWRGQRPGGGPAMRSESRRSGPGRPGVRPADRPFGPRAEAEHSPARKRPEQHEKEEHEESHPKL